MKSGTTLLCALLVLTFGTRTATGQELSRYRGFELGSSVATVLTATQTPTTQVKTLHQRPAVIQELEWRPSRWMPGVVAASTDPVDQITFTFYDDQLFHIVVDYGHGRTTGLTEADLVDAISMVYGMPLPAPTRNARVPSKPETDTGTAIAKWGDAEYSIALVRTPSYSGTWRLTLSKTTLETLAARAEAQALKLEAIEAPQKEIERQMQERERERIDAEKARGVNKPSFKP